MIANAHNSPPSLVIDANGLEWKRIIWVDTETGDGEQYAVDEQGKRIINAAMTDIVKHAVKLAAPVLIVPATEYKTKAEWDAAIKEVKHEIYTKGRR